MICVPPTGAIEGVFISAVSHEGLSVIVNSKPGQLAILNEAGEIVASGSAVAREVEAVAVLNYRQFLQGKGYLHVMGKPISVQASAHQGDEPGPHDGSA